MNITVNMKKLFLFGPLITVQLINTILGIILVYGVLISFVFVKFGVISVFGGK